MQNAFAMLGGNREVRARQFEAGRAFFHHYCVARLGQILLQGSRERVCFHTSIVAPLSAEIATENPRHVGERDQNGHGMFALFPSGAEPHAFFGVSGTAESHGSWPTKLKVAG
jgi:hypothetical protein